MKGYTTAEGYMGYVDGEVHAFCQVNLNTESISSSSLAMKAGLLIVCMA